MTLLLVLAGGAVGAPLRYVTDRLVQKRHDQVFPWGTLVVNVAGSFLLGALLGTAGAGLLPPWVAPLVGVGFCGALTTFSTFSFETLRLLEESALVEAGLNVVVTLLAGIAACSGAYAGVSALL